MGIALPRAAAYPPWRARNSEEPLPHPDDVLTMVRSMAERDTRRDVGVVTRTKKKDEVKRPKRYRVLLHNDDYTTMEFVVWVLQSVFHHDETTAMEIMLHVHKNGLGVAGVYPRELAEARVAKVDALARDHEYPLRTSMEEE
jgi:ATP-dependent Clp protease adaptor protein ClpS